MSVSLTPVMLNCPFVLLITDVFVPFIVMVAPGKGSPLSSRTSPFMVLSCNSDVVFLSIGLDFKDTTTDLSSREYSKGCPLKIFRSTSFSSAFLTSMLIGEASLSVLLVNRKS
ncbi:hypothetical protein D3C79_1008470 [compost metagenome]